MKNNELLMSMARESLKGKWGLAIGTVFIYYMISFAVSLSIGSQSPLAGQFINFLIGGPLLIGLSRFALSIAKGEQAGLEQIFEGFNDFARGLIAYFLMIILIAVGFVLLIVPGVIVALMLSQTFYILSEDREISVVEALRRSRTMMNGHKSQLFVMGLMFLGLAILCIFTLGIGFLWLLPFMHVSYANFYREVKANSAYSDEDQTELDLLGTE